MNTLINNRANIVDHSAAQAVLRSLEVKVEKELKEGLIAFINNPTQVLPEFILDIYYSSNHPLEEVVYLMQFVPYLLNGWRMDSEEYEDFNNDIRNSLFRNLNRENKIKYLISLINGDTKSCYLLIDGEYEVLSATKPYWYTSVTIVFDVPKWVELEEIKNFSKFPSIMREREDL